MADEDRNDDTKDSDPFSLFIIAWCCQLWAAHLWVFTILSKPIYLGDFVIAGSLKCI